MTKPSEAQGTETVEEQLLALKNELARTQAHLHHVTQQTLTHQEKIEDFVRTPRSPDSQATLMSRQGIFISAAVVAVNNTCFSSEKDEPATKEAKRVLFGK